MVIPGCIVPLHTGVNTITLDVPAHRLFFNGTGITSESRPDGWTVDHELDFLLSLYEFYLHSVVCMYCHARLALAPIPREDLLIRARAVRARAFDLSSDFDMLARFVVPNPNAGVWF
jgi:hypothetical protein